MIIFFARMCVIFYHHFMCTAFEKIVMSLSVSMSYQSSCPHLMVSMSPFFPFTIHKWNVKFGNISRYMHKHAKRLVEIKFLLRIDRNQLLSYTYLELDWSCFLMQLLDIERFNNFKHLCGNNGSMAIGRPIKDKLEEKQERAKKRNLSQSPSQRGEKKRSPNPTIQPSNSLSQITTQRSLLCIKPTPIT